MNPEEIIFKNIDVLIKLSEACWHEFDIRRQYEWKVSFGLWTALGIISGFALKENIILPFDKLLLIPILSIILLAYLWWHIGLRNSNRHDQDKRHEYYKVIHKELDFYKRLDDANDIFLEKQWENEGKQLTDDEKVKGREKVKKEAFAIFAGPPSTSSGLFLKVWSHGTQIAITVVFLFLLGSILWNKDPNRKGIEDNKSHCCKRIECQK